MSRHDIHLMMSAVWLVSMLSVFVFYVICACQAHGLTEKKASVLLGDWYLSPKNFPTAEGKLWCRRGGLAVLMLISLFAVQALAWEAILDYLASL